MIILAYQHTNAKGTTYHLHSKEVQLRGSGKMQRIFYFARVAGPAAINDLPAGYKVVENSRTGLPILKKV